MTVESRMPRTDVKDHLSEVVDQVERDHDRVAVTNDGRPAAVVVSVADPESLEDALDVVARPTLITPIRDSLTDLDRETGHVLSRDDVLLLRGGARRPTRSVRRSGVLAARANRPNFRIGLTFD